MCGIVGFIHHKLKLSKEELIKMTATIAYRGPDDEGYFLSNFDDYQIGMGFRRLAILDLSPKGHQPMIFKNYVITFNGEIYNYQEIRLDLKNLGYHFDSDSDTEVILKAFDKWGIEIADRFIGMFAMAIFDQKLNELYLIRDRIGIKPLYYCLQNNNLIYASELKPIMAYPYFSKNLDGAAFSEYLYHGYITSPASIFQNVYKLKPGTWLKFSDGKVSVSSFWDLKDKFQLNNTAQISNREQALTSLDDLLTSSIKYRMIADVSIGSFLSGGYDSSLVTAIMQKLSNSPVNTFTVGFNEDNFNEANYANKISKYLGTNHHEIYLPINKTLELINDLPLYFDEPFGDSSALPTILVSRLAKGNATVILSGDGGDELFCGYKNYESALRLQKLKLLGKSLGVFQKHIDIAKWFYKINRRFGRYPYLDNNTNTINVNYLLSKYIIGDVFLKDAYKVNHSLFNQGIKTNIIQEQYMVQDMLTYLPDDILTKVDRASMSISLETRVPLLDHRIVEFSFQLSHNLKNNGGIPKYILKELAHKYIPKEYLDRPKHGFAVPVFKWLKTDLRPLMDVYLSRNYLEKQNIFNPASITRLLKMFEKAENTEFIGHYLWNILIFQLWYNKYMK